MAAGQQKKRLNAASVTRFNVHDGSRGKKMKKMESSDVILNMTSHVSLEWDGSQNRAVAKRGQVGITRREMASFLDPIPQLRSCLADVFSVPQEIFGLESITDVLSHEVWETYLSEEEKKLLIQFLPSCADVDLLLQSLLEGENLHFGNPVCKWGALLCAGNLHPDAIVKREKQLRANRKEYFAELKKYQIEIIEKLSKLKEMWTNCKNPEKDTKEKILRHGIAKSTLPFAPEKARVSSYSEKEQPHKRGICDGGTKYMSYFKISKKQHQLVTNIKQSGDGIQSKSLNRVLGDIKQFNIQPYAVFEEEERKRLHECWFQLANKDIPAAFENHKECRLLIEKWRYSVQNELARKREGIAKKDEKDTMKWSSEQVEDTDSEQESVHAMQNEGYIQPCCTFTDSSHLKRISALNSHPERDPLSSEPGKKLDVLESTSHSIHHSKSDCHVAEVPSLNSPQEHNSSLDREGSGNMVEKETSFLPSCKFGEHENIAEGIMELNASPFSDFHNQETDSSPNSPKGFYSVAVHEGDQDKMRSTASVVWQFPGSMITARDAIETKTIRSVSCSKDIGQQGSDEHPFCHPTAESQGYASTCESSLQHPEAVVERAAQLINLEAKILDQEDAGSVALHVDNRATVFSSYANQEHNLLLPPCHEEKGMLPFFLPENLNGLKQSGLQFAVKNSGLVRCSQFPTMFQEQQETLLEQNQSRQRDTYVHQMRMRNMPSSGRYPSQGHFPLVGSQGWTSLQYPVKVGLSDQNWFLGSHHTCHGLSVSESSGSVGRCIGDDSSIDGSLFGVLSECNKLPSSSPYVTTRFEHFPPGANFSGRASANCDIIDIYPPLLGNASSRDAAALKMNSLAWMNFSHQNAGLPESLRKSYLQSWNQ